MVGSTIHLCIVVMLLSNTLNCLIWRFWKCLNSWNMVYSLVPFWGVAHGAVYESLWIKIGQHQCMAWNHHSSSSRLSAHKCVNSSEYWQLSNEKEKRWSAKLWFQPSSMIRSFMIENLFKFHPVWLSYY